MESKESRCLSNEKIFQIFSSFMLRITQFDDLVDAGNRYLIGFQQGLGKCLGTSSHLLQNHNTYFPPLLILIYFTSSKLEFLRRPPIDTTSELVERIVKANMTRRFSSYIQAGCLNPHDSKQNMNKLSTCHLGLLDNLNRAKSVLSELQCLVDDAAAVVQASNHDLPHWQDKDTNFDVNSFATGCSRKLGITDYAVLMALIYGMVKQDYEMQEKIVSSLSLKSSSGELESYCLMWSLRPFVDDEIMQKAWGHIP